MTEQELYAKAIEASGLSARRFAFEVLGVDERTGRRWEGAERSIPGTVLIVCRAIVDRPAIVKELTAAALSVKEELLAGKLTS